MKKVKWKTKRNFKKPENYMDKAANIINVIHTMAILKTEIYKYGFMKKGLIIACAIHMFLTTRLTSNTTEPLKKIPLSALYSPLPIIFSSNWNYFWVGELMPSILTPLYQAYMLLWSSAPTHPRLFFSYAINCCTIFTKKNLTFFTFFLLPVLNFPTNI